MALLAAACQTDSLPTCPYRSMARKSSTAPGSGWHSPPLYPTRLKKRQWLALKAGSSRSRGRKASSPEHEKQTAYGTGLEPTGHWQHHPKHSKQKWSFAIAVLGLIVVLAAVLDVGVWPRKHNSSASLTSAKSSTTGIVSPRRAHPRHHSRWLWLLELPDNQSRSSSLLIWRNGQVGWSLSNAWLKLD